MYVCRRNPAVGYVAGRYVRHVAEATCNPMLFSPNRFSTDSASSRASCSACRSPALFPPHFSSRIRPGASHVCRRCVVSRVHVEHFARVCRTCCGALCTTRFPQRLMSIHIVVHGDELLDITTCTIVHNLGIMFPRRNSAVASVLPRLMCVAPRCEFHRICMLCKCVSRTFGSDLQY